MVIQVVAHVSYKSTSPVRDCRIAGFLPSKSPWAFYPPPKKKQAKLPMMTVRGILYLLQMVFFFFFFSGSFQIGFGHP